VQDSVAVEHHDRPVIVVVTSEFETHARNMARFLGHPDLKVLVLPYPLEARPDAELREISETHYPLALSLLGARP
ncbi:MAG: UGSC family (seleno)protein, partial [Acidimicrobiia bacterium]